MPPGRAISVFLIDGVPEGRVMCELFNWTGKGYKVPRRMLKESADRAALFKAGVYFLFGRDEGRNEINAVYVGEAESVYRRLPAHQDKDFWTEVLIFVSKDDNLNKAHIKFLEHTIHAKVREAGRYELKNSNTPNKPEISEVDQAVMTEFLANLQLLTGAMGYKLFEPLISPATTAVETYTLQNARGADARAVYTSDGMVVRKGSFATRDEVNSVGDSTRKLRKQLVEQSVLVAEDNRLVFAVDHIFSSPSSAASAIQGRQANGWVEWKDAAGNTLKDNEAPDAPPIVEAETLDG